VDHLAADKGPAGRETFGDREQGMPDLFPAGWA